MICILALFLNVICLSPLLTFSDHLRAHARASCAALIRAKSTYLRCSLYRNGITRAHFFRTHARAHAPRTRRSLFYVIFCIAHTTHTPQRSFACLSRYRWTYRYVVVGGRRPFWGYISAGCMVCAYHVCVVDDSSGKEGRICIIRTWKRRTHGWFLIYDGRAFSSSLSSSIIHFGEAGSSGWVCVLCVTSLSFSLSSLWLFLCMALPFCACLGLCC